MKQLVIILTLLPMFVYAQEDEIDYIFNGFVDTYHSVRSKSPNDFMSSRSRLRTELNITKGKTSMFASLNSIYNKIVEEETKIELHEAYFQYSDSHWDFKAGRQIIIWGVADGIRITDLVSPMDYTEFLARDYDDIRIPVNAFRLKYLNNNFTFEAVYLPVSSFFKLPLSEKNPWSLFQSSEMYLNHDLEHFPEKKLANGEFGTRFSFFMSGIDFSFSAFHTWNKIPILNQTFSQNYDTLNICGMYKRMDMIGMDFSFPIRQFVVRGETALFFDELQQAAMGNENVNRNSAHFLFGLDWYPGGEWTVTGQYSHKYIADYTNVIEADENSSLATLGITKKILRSTLKLSTFGYYDLSNKGMFNRISADYSLTDQIYITAGYDWFKGDKGMFGFYKNNSEYWVKAKFSF